MPDEGVIFCKLQKMRDWLSLNEKRVMQMQKVEQKAVPSSGSLQAGIQVIRLLFIMNSIM